MRLLYLTIAWCAGILIAAANNSHQTVLWFTAALCAAFAVLFTRRIPHRRAIHILIFAFALGGLRFALQPEGSALAAYNGRGGLTAEGMIVSEPQPRNDRLRFQLQVDVVTFGGRSYAAQGVALVETPSELDLRYGDRVRATGDMFRPATFDNFSYADFLARINIFSHMPFAAVETTESPAEASFPRLIYDLRSSARIAIANALPEPYAGLLTGILLGDERSIAPELEEAFSKTGASHIIAISGYNMAVVSGIVISVLNSLKVRPRSAAIIALVVVGLYTLFVGASASVLRAALMSGLWITAEYIIRRKTFLPASLAFAALVMSLINPTVLWDVGFQLSFFATLSIVLFATPMTRWMQTRLDRWLPENTAANIGGFLAPTLIVSLAAQVLTLPLIALYFERVSLVSLLVNVLVLPVQPAILVLGALAIFTSVIPALSLSLFWAALLPLAWTTTIVRAIAALPFAETAAQLPANLIALFFLLIMGVAMLQAQQPAWLDQLVTRLRQRAILTTTALISAGLLILCLAIFTSRPDGNLHVWILTMGHTNAILAQTPGGAQILVDGGRFPTSLLLAMGDRLPFYDRSLEVLAITQPDEFDTAALSDVLARYPAQLVLTNGQPNLNPDFVVLQETWGKAQVVAARAGYSLSFSDGTILDVLHPQSPPSLEDRLDDGALVLRLRFGEQSILISGDVNANGQRTMLEEAIDVSASALLMPQHGAPGALSQSFLEAVNPQVVLLHSDPANRLNHPDPDTLAQVESLPLFRTDEYGVLHIVTDGQQLWVEPG
jgi:competence protein ComEC